MTPSFPPSVFLGNAKETAPLAQICIHDLCLAGVEKLLCRIDCNIEREGSCNMLNDLRASYAAGLQVKTARANKSNIIIIYVHVHTLYAVYFLYDCIHY